MRFDFASSARAGLWCPPQIKTGGRMLGMPVVFFNFMEKEKDA
jgi:hypothetical protein